MLVENVKVKGMVTFELKDEHGNVKQTEQANMIVTTGLSHFTSRLIGVVQDIMSHMAVGTGGTAAATGQTALITEAARVALASLTQVTTTVTSDAVQAVATFPAGTGTGALVEAGIFNAASAGVMEARTVFAVINKGALDSLTITWKITFA